LKRQGEKVFYILNRNIAWLIGACIYFSANGVYAVALSFAPVSVLSVVFSLTIITNAACARCLLGDRVPMLAIPGYILILVGAILFSLMVDADVCSFEEDELVRVLTSTSAIIYWVLLTLVIFGGLWFAKWFEKAFPLAEITQDNQIESKYQDHDTGPQSLSDNNGICQMNETNAEAQNEQINESNNDSSSNSDIVNSKSYLFARLIYPTSLGAIEAAGTLVLKAVNSLFTNIITEDSESDISTNTTSTLGSITQDDTFQGESTNVGLWVGLLVIGILLFLGIVGWLRLVYRRFEISGAFPVEFGFVTFASVIGGFTVYQDYQFVNGTSAWVGIVCAGIIIICGIVLVAFSSWRANLLKS